MKPHLSLFALATVVLCSLPPLSLVLTGLRCEYKTNPRGIDSLHPRLSWQLQSGMRGQRQTAYEVLVARTEAALKANRGDLWDSGKVASSQTIAITYAGGTLRSGPIRLLRVFHSASISSAIAYSR